MSHPDRQDAIRPRRRLVASLLVAFVAIAGLLAPATAATAAEIPGAVTSVSTDKTTYGYNEKIKLSFTWAVPDSAVAGDSFQLQLPDELQASSLATFPLRAPDGTVVAWGSWSGKTIVVTLTDYVDTHDGVGGNGFVTAQWDKAVVPTTGAPLSLEFAGTAIEVVIQPQPPTTPPCTENCPPPKPPTPPATSRDLAKSGSWSDGNTYEGTRDATGNIKWTVRLPGSPEGYVGPIEIVDTPGAGSIVECDTLKVTSQLTLANGSTRTIVDADRLTIDCAPGGFTIVLDEIAATEFVWIEYRGTITDQALGSYGNSVTVDIPGQPGEKTVTMRRTSAGGDGDGVQSVSVGDLVWLDTDRDGRQGVSEAGIPGVVLRLTGPTGAPVTDIDGTPVGTTTTDADGHYLFGRLPVLPAGQHYTVTIDGAASAVALEGLFSTTAGAGTDRGVDSSTGSAESTDLTTNGAIDPTLDFGFVGIELPTLPQPEPELPTLPGELASTGTEPIPATVAALAAALLGIAFVVVSRRRRRA